MHTQECRPCARGDAHVFALGCRLPLMIVVITRSGKSHFHKATPPPLGCHSLSISGLLLFFSSLPPSFSVVFLCSSPLPSLLSSACLHLLSFSSSPSRPHLPPIPCDLLIPLSYSVFCPKRIFPPTQPRLIPPSLSIYLYQ